MRMQKKTPTLWLLSRPVPNSCTVAAEEHAHIHAMIDTLPEQLRVPLVLASFQELSSRDVGAVLGIPEGTVRTRLQRARLMLREKLARLHARRQEVHHA